MSAHEPQGYELAAFKYFKELQTDCQDSDLPLFLDNFKRELAEMKAYMEANGSDERTAFEAVFCEPTTAPEPKDNKIPLPPIAVEMPTEADIEIERQRAGLPPLSTLKKTQAQQPPDFLKADEWFGTDISKDFLDFTEPYQKPHYTLSKDGIPFAPLGGIHAITGQSGHGKTMTFTQFMAAILSGGFGGLRYEQSDSIPKPIVLYIDTEMEKDNTIAVKNRVCELIGRNPQQSYDDFKILMLRETEEAIDRWRKTLQAIYVVRPTVVFIDGLLDLVNDFNQNDECQRKIYECMQIATHYQSSVWCLVHQNPGNTTKLVGHLGSMLERKVTDVFTTIKETNDKTGDVTFTIKQTKARGRDVPAWKFRVLPVGCYGRPEQIDESTDFDDIEKVREWLQQGQNLIEWPATANEIKRIFKECGGVGSSDRQQRDLKAAQNRRLIVEQDKAEWEQGQKHPKYYLNR